MLSNEPRQDVNELVLHYLSAVFLRGEEQRFSGAVRIIRFMAAAHSPARAMPAVAADPRGIVRRDSTIRVSSLQPIISTNSRIRHRADFIIGEDSIIDDYQRGCASGSARTLLRDIGALSFVPVSFEVRPWDTDPLYPAPQARERDEPGSPA